jgi:hypothetical protein
MEGATQCESSIMASLHPGGAAASLDKLHWPVCSMRGCTCPAVDSCPIAGASVAIGATRGVASQPDAIQGASVFLLRSFVLHKGRAGSIEGASTSSGNECQRPDSNPGAATKRGVCVAPRVCSSEEAAMDGAFGVGWSADAWASSGSTEWPLCVVALGNVMPFKLATVPCLAGEGVRAVPAGGAVATGSLHTPEDCVPEAASSSGSVRVAWLSDIELASQAMGLPDADASAGSTSNGLVGAMAIVREELFSHLLAAVAA